MVVLPAQGRPDPPRKELEVVQEDRAGARPRRHLTAPHLRVAGPRCRWPAEPADLGGGAAAGGSRRRGTPPGALPRAARAPLRRGRGRGWREARELFAGRVVWHVNSTARGGGVAEMLQSLLAYARGAGVDARWVGDRGRARLLPDHQADPQPPARRRPATAGRWARRSARSTSAALTSERRASSRQLVRAGDVVFLHDPQTAGLVRPMRETGAHGRLALPRRARPAERAGRARLGFLRPYVSRPTPTSSPAQEFVWEGLDRDADLDRRRPRSTRSRRRTRSSSRDRGARSSARPDSSHGAAPDAPALHPRGRHAGPGRPHAPRSTRRAAPGRGAARLPGLALGPPQGPDRACCACFAEHVAGDPDAHLLLAGPVGRGGRRRPRGRRGARRGRSPTRGDAAGRRSARRVHLALLPMDDIEENAAIVNAIQRRSDVVVQKSLAEGFGLTVAEAMWKARPVVASRLGGIQDQIVDGETGILLDDPRGSRGLRGGSAPARVRRRATRPARGGGEAPGRRAVSRHPAPPAVPGAADHAARRSAGMRPTV